MPVRAAPALAMRETATWEGVRLDDRGRRGFEVTGVTKQQSP